MSTMQMSLDGTNLPFGGTSALFSWRITCTLFTLLYILENEPTFQLRDYSQNRLILCRRIVLFHITILFVKRIWTSWILLIFWLFLVTKIYLSKWLDYVFYYGLKGYGTPLSKLSRTLQHQHLALFFMLNFLERR